MPATIFVVFGGVFIILLCCGVCIALTRLRLRREREVQDSDNSVEVQMSIIPGGPWTVSTEPEEYLDEMLDGLGRTKERQLKEILEEVGSYGEICPNCEVSDRNTTVILKRKPTHWHSMWSLEPVCTFIYAESGEYYKDPMNDDFLEWEDVIYKCAQHYNKIILRRCQCGHEWVELPGEKK